MGLDPPEHRVERGAARSDGVGHRRQADRHAFACIALGLPVQRLMLAELLEQDHRQEAWAGPAPGDHMERGRRLTDLLAIPAAELFPYRFDHLPLPGITSSVRVTSSPSLRSRVPPQHSHVVGGAITTRSRGRWSGEGVSFGALAREARHIRGFRHGDFRGELILAGAGCKFLELQRQLIDQPLRSLRTRAVELTLEAGRSATSDGQSAPGLRKPWRAPPPARRPRRRVRRQLRHPRALDHQRRLQCGDVVRQRGKIGVHDRE